MILLEEIFNKSQSMIIVNIRDLQLSEFVTNPITVNKDNKVKVAITKMIKYNVSGLPILNNSRRVGIITKSDIVSILAN